MSEFFQGVTFDEQLVTPYDDAALYAAILPDGIIHGCRLTYSGNALTMEPGLLILSGRVIRHTSAETWRLTEDVSGFARILLNIDLSFASSENSFKQVFSTVEYAQDMQGFPELQQDPINISGARYQVVACVVTLSDGAITAISEEIRSASLRENFAPKGYGLGEAFVTKKPALRFMSGWYRASQPALPGEPDYLGDRLVRTDALSASFVCDTMYLSDGVIIRRYGEDFTRLPWEFENPPMKPGVVYQTTQRHNGKPVFAVRMDNIAMKDSGVSTVLIPDEAAELVSLEGYARSDVYSERQAFPLITEGGSVGASLKLTGTSTLQLKSFADYSTYTASVTVKYTKT